jgi:hypothetical protein
MMHHGRRTRSLALLYIASTLLASPSLAIEASGTTIGVAASSTATGPQGLRVLEVQGPVFMGDEITTDRRGQAQINFVDDTKFVVGPNSRVVIDSFVFDPNKAAQDVGVSAVKGAFRFITGSSPKQAYSIRTPTMTIGVRGTAFDLAVRPGGESTIAVHEGETRLCDALRTCIEGKPGDVIVAPPGGGFQSLSGLSKKQKVAVFFPFVVTQQGLDPAFQVASPVSEIGATGGAGSNTGENDEFRPVPSRPTKPTEPNEPDEPPDGRPPR